jgi:glycerol kinase
VTSQHVLWNVVGVLSECLQQRSVGTSKLSSHQPWRTAAPASCATSVDFLDEVDGQWALDRSFTPAAGRDASDRTYADWRRAVERCRGWVTA